MRSRRRRPTAAAARGAEANPSTTARQRASTGELARIAQRLFRLAPLRERTLARLRPWICPFDELVSLLPSRAHVLDIGCGNGLLLGLAASQGHVESAIGIDADARAISTASQMALHAFPQRLRFSCTRAEDPWPAGPCSVISLIDVMHHVDPSHQLTLLDRACAAVPKGGMLVYKDMAERPRWRAGANRLHDLILARQWIHYLAIDSVVSRGQAQGLALVRRSTTARFCYQHELAVFMRPLI